MRIGPVSCLAELDDVSDTSHEIILWTSLLLFQLYLSNAGASLLLRDTYATDRASLFLSHARVDVDVFRTDEKCTISRTGEPAI